MKVVCGPFQPGLERAFLARVRELKPSAQNPIAVVAPSRRLADRLERLLCVEHGLSLLGVRFHTFFSLASELVEASGGAGAAVVGDPLFHDRLVDGLLRKAKRYAMSRGLGAAFRASIRDLSDAGVETEASAELDLLARDPERKTALAYLLKLLGDYRAALAKMGALPGSGLPRAAAELVKDGRAGALSRYGELLYYGFYDLTGVQADFFAAVAASHPVTVFYPYLKDHPAYAFCRPFVETYLHGAESAPEYLPEDADSALGTGLGRLFSPERRGEPLLEPHGAERFEDGREEHGLRRAAKPALKLYSVSGARDQLWRAAKELRRLHDEEGVPFADMGVAARTLEPFRALAEEVFAEHAVPYWTPEGGPVLRHPAARLALVLLTLEKRDYPASAVLDLLESPYFRLDAHEGEHEGRALLWSWKRLIARLGVHSGWLQWEGKLAHWANRDFPLDSEEQRQGARLLPAADNAALWKLVAGLRDDFDKAHKLDRWTERAAFARMLLERHLAVPADDPGRPAYEAVLTALDELTAYDALDTLTPLSLHEGEGLGVRGGGAGGPGAKGPDSPRLWEDFLDTLEEKLRRASLDPAPPNAGVRLLNAMDARGESFRALFLLGLEEGMFPRQAREDPLLPDDVRSALRQTAGFWLHGKLAEGYEEERLLFTLLVGSAREKLYCVYARSDDAGKAQVPSPYLRELLEACGLELEKAELERTPRPLPAKLESMPPAALTPKEALVLAERGGEKTRPLYAALGLEEELCVAAHEHAFALKGEGKPGRMDAVGVVSPEFNESCGECGFSPSALEEFATCPFKFFADRVLGLDPGDEPSDRGQLTPQARGKLYHEVLERFYKRLLDERFWEHHPPPREGEGRGEGALRGWEKTLDETIDAAFKEHDWRTLGVYPLLWESARRRMSVWLKDFVKRDLELLGELGLHPARFEVELEGRGGALRLHGRADRVDLGGGHSRIVDYKTRWPRSTEKLYNKVVKLENLQPAIYQELLAQSAWAPKGEGAHYGAELLIIEGGLDRVGIDWIQRFSAEDYARARADLLVELAAMAQRMARGEFFISPAEGRFGHCEYCPFGALCRKAHPASRRRAERLARVYDKDEIAGRKVKRTEEEAHA
ncbi:MAG: PD-(D/E)XK nuclease family protein [Elusimicrobiota bacterium]